MDNNLIKWYLAYNNFTNQQKNYIQKSKITNINIINQNKTVSDYFSLMLYSNIDINNYNINFGDNGRFFINCIFNQLVTDQTLIITTKYQHDTVKANLKLCKNVIQLQIDDIINFDREKILSYIENFNNIFVYIIGVQIMTGQITPQQFFIQIRNLLIQKKKNFKLMIDDVHGMFLIPRDYSIFDYILYTAHSLIPNYQMGFLISRKQNKQFGIINTNYGEEYLNKLRLILTKKDKLFLFKTVMTQYFSDILKKNKIYKLLSPTVQHIFSIQTAGLFFTQKIKEKLLQYKIKIEQQNYYYNHIRIRYQEFIMLQYDKAIEGLQYLRKCLTILQNIQVNIQQFDR